uniref:Uncharacterized protein n=1 Tax=Helianthus annuus TaxID=4232 RepID=A0A251U4I3_HELAN
MCLMMGLSFLLQKDYQKRLIPSDDIVSKSQQARCAQRIDEFKLLSERSMTFREVMFINSDGNLTPIELLLRSRCCMLEWALEFK